MNKNVFDEKVNVALMNVNEKQNYACLGERFYPIANQLKQGEKIGFMISLGNENSICAFTSESVDMTLYDYNWMMGGFATISDFETTKLLVDSDIDNFHSYQVYCKGCFSNESKSLKWSGHSNESNELYSLLKGLDAKIVITAINDESVKVGIQIFTNCELTLSQKAIFSQVLSNMYLDESNEEQINLINNVPSGYIVMLMRSYFYQGKKLKCDNKFPIEELELSVRTYNVLKRAAINTVGDFIGKSDDELLKIRNMGKKSLDEIKGVISSIDYSESDEDEIDSVFEDDDLGFVDFDDDLDIGLEEKHQEKKHQEEKHQEEKKESLNAKDELEALIGLGNVKLMVNKISSYAKMLKFLRESNVNTRNFSLHTAFYGNPGTAKTTVARIYAKMLYKLGLIKCDEIYEIGRSNLVGRYVGETAIKVKEVFERGKGRLIFIDEAYSLVDRDSNSFGDEAITTIVQEMENRREDTVVVFAGYPDELKELFDRNPGFKSRIQFNIDFENYSVGELLEITRQIADANGFVISHDCDSKLKEIFNKSRMSKDFGNGRFCRNLVEKAIINFAYREFGAEEKEEIYFLLTPEDFVEEIKDEEKPIYHIGFAA